MSSLILMALLALGVSCNVSCRETKEGKQLLKETLHNKRGIGDSFSAYTTGEPSYSFPIHSNLNAGYNRAALASYTFGHPASIQSLSGTTLPHSLGAGSSGLSSAISLNVGQQGLAYGGDGAHSSLIPTSINGRLFTPSLKNGPVTFGIHGGYSPPTYATGLRGLSAYGGKTGTDNILSAMLGSQYDSSASYSYPMQSATYSPSYPVIGGLMGGIESYGKSSSIYNLPVSPFPGYSSPISHTISNSGESIGYDLPVSSKLIARQLSLPVGSLGSSSYSSPAFLESDTIKSSGYSNQILPSPDVSTYSSGGSYASPSSTDTISHSSASNSVSSYSNPSVNYSYSSYPSSYTVPSSSYGIPAEPQSSYTTFNPKSVGHSETKVYETEILSKNKYDTISYSKPNGKY